MPRANRYILPGYVYHLTYRCHDRKFLLIDTLLWLLCASSVAEFRLHLNAALEEAIAKDQLKREPKWLESLAVGSQAFVGKIQNRVRNQQ